MCGISGVELLVIIVAAIIVLGPDRLPELMRMAGRIARELRRLRGDLGDVTREIRSTVDVRSMGRELARDVDVDRFRARVHEAENEIDAIRRRLNRPIESADLMGPSESGGSHPPVAEEANPDWDCDGMGGPATLEDPGPRPASGQVARHPLLGLHEEPKEPEELEEQEAGIEPTELPENEA